MLQFPMQLIRKICREFRTITPEDYLFNQRAANLASRIQITTLKPLAGANQGDQDLIDDVQLVGLTKHEEKKSSTNSIMVDQYQNIAYSGVDLNFLQIDPSEYMARQRFLSHKCALGNAEDYRKDGIDLIDPHKPYTWEQTIVNLFTLDMLHTNTLPSQTTYKKGMYAYSYPYLQEKSDREAVVPVFINSISNSILGGTPSQYPVINKMLYAGLMGKHKVMLGGMPETLYKMILGQSLSIQEMRDIFRTVILKNKELTTPFTTKQAAQNFMPHIFMLPKDLYMTALLKESFQAAIHIACAVGVEHWRPIQQYWVGPPHGINLTDATTIPVGFAGETTQDLIEKQAIMDVLLETRTWSKSYLSNPFPYLFSDITKIQPKQLQHYKQTFLLQYRKYSEFKKRQLKQLPHIQSPKMIDFIKKQTEQLQKMEGAFNGHKLSHLKDKMNLKINKSFKDYFK